MKKLITFASFVALGVASFALPAHALPADAARTVDDTSAGANARMMDDTSAGANARTLDDTSAGANARTTEGEPMPISETAGSPVETVTTDCDLDDDVDCISSIAGTNCIGSTDANCVTTVEEYDETEEEIDDEEEGDPEMWPVYLSLGALGVTILLIIIINIATHSRKK